MIVNVVQAKATSRRLPHKNALRLAGHRDTLTDLAIRAAAVFPGDIYLSSDIPSDYLCWPQMDCASRVKQVWRPRLLAEDKHSNRASLLWLLSRMDLLDAAMGIRLFQPSNPFRTRKLVNAMNAMIVGDRIYTPTCFNKGSMFWIPTRLLVTDDPWKFEQISVGTGSNYDAFSYIDIDTVGDLPQANKIAVDHYTEVTAWRLLNDVG